MSLRRELKRRARELRKNMTEAERLLWAELRRKQVLGVQFYRQKPIGPYVADFYCHKARLVIELDGTQHQDPAHAERDRIRDQTFRGLGLSVLRFRNHQVLDHRSDVVTEIERSISRALSRTDPPRSPTEYIRFERH